MELRVDPVAAETIGRACVSPERRAVIGTTEIPEIAAPKAVKVTAMATIANVTVEERDVMMTLTPAERVIGMTVIASETAVPRRRDTTSRAQYTVDTRDHRPLKTAMTTSRTRAGRRTASSGSTSGPSVSARTGALAIVITVATCLTL